MPGLYISLIAIGFSIIACIALNILDKYYENRDIKYGYKLVTSEADKMVLKDVCKFRVDYWCLCIICGALYSCIIVFVQFSGDYFKRMFSLKADDSTYSY